MAIMSLPEGFNLASRNGATCSICGTGPQQNDHPTQVISTGIVIDWEGSFDICWGCARELGRLAHMVDRAAYDALVEDYAALLAQFNDQSVAFMDKEDAVRLLAGELVGASKRGIYGTHDTATAVEVEPDFGGEA